jgi:hypothetical protein
VTSGEVGASSNFFAQLRRETSDDAFCVARFILVMPIRNARGLRKPHTAPGRRQGLVLGHALAGRIEVGLYEAAQYGGAL